MTDTHTHIYEPEFDEDRDETVLRAVNAGVLKLLLPNINEGSLPRMMALARKYPNICHPMIGLHPEDVKEDYMDVLDRMEKMLREQYSESNLTADGTRFIAIGEVGLDFYWDSTYRTQQIDAFERQICWARDYHLPLMIHTRKAEPELLSAVNRHKSDGLKGVFHCFSGSRESAAQLLEFEGFALGIGGVLTFKKSRLPETLKNVPLDRIVLETDSPYLAPVPHRGTRNESLYISEIAKVVSDVYGVTTKEVEMVTDATVKRIFGHL